LKQGILLKTVADTTGRDLLKIALPSKYVK